MVNSASASITSAVYKITLLHKLSAGNLCRDWICSEVFAFVARVGFGPTMTAPKAVALPLGYRAIKIPL